jgi:methylated-DNA-[protein]-cysteine S-methyltransferase
VIATVSYSDMESPVGRLLLVGGPAGLVGIQFQSERNRPAIDPRWQHEPGVFVSLVQQLNEYFAGRRRVFSVTLAPQGTAFQQSVWHTLQAIPYGTVRSYAEIARQIGKPRAFRAVGRANGANPWPIVVPCHRVIGSDQSLTGFGGGLDIKRRLLALEAENGGSQDLWSAPVPGLVEDARSVGQDG